MGQGHSVLMGRCLLSFAADPTTSRDRRRTCSSRGTFEVIGTHPRLNRIADHSISSFWLSACSGLCS